MVSVVACHAGDLGLNPVRLLSDQKTFLHGITIDYWSRGMCFSMPLIYFL